MTAQERILGPGGEGERGRRCKHQTPSESPTGVGDHRGLVLGISPPPPEHIEEPLTMIGTLKIMKMTQMMKMMKMMKMVDMNKGGLHRAGGKL